MTTQPGKSKFLIRQFILIILLIISLIILVKFAFPFFNRIPFWAGDYETYWVTGRVFLEGKNPYLLENIKETKLSFGIPYTSSDGVSRYPPWSILFMALFGIFDLSTSRLVWLLLLLVTIFLSSDFFWREYNGFSKNRWSGQLLTLFFAPTFFVLGRVQLTPLVLLGIVLFMFFAQKKKNYWFAGASLVFLTIKPHIPYLFLIAIGLWVWKERKWGVIFGGVLTILLFIIIAELINPQITWHYITAHQENYSQLEWATPTIGFQLRAIFGYQYLWLSFLPPLVGVGWLLIYWNKFSHLWNWFNQVSPLLMASIISSIFCWTYDQVVLLPAILFSGAHILKSTSKIKKPVFFICYLLINIITVVLHRNYDDSFFFWFAPLLLALYFISR